MEHAMSAPKTGPEAASPRTRNHHPERITLDDAAVARISDWMAELAVRLKGSSVTRNQLVSWLINQHDRELSTPEVRGLEQAFFDEVKFAEWAWAELKAAQARGEPASLSEIIARHRPARAERGRGD